MYTAVAVNVSLFSSSNYVDTVLYGRQQDLDFSLKVETIKYCLKGEGNNIVISFDSSFNKDLDMNEIKYNNLPEPFDEYIIKWDYISKNEFSYKFSYSNDMTILFLECKLGEFENNKTMDILFKLEIIPDFVIVNIIEFATYREMGERKEKIGRLYNYLNKIYSKIPMIILNSNDDGYNVGFCRDLSPDMSEDIDISECMYVGYKYENYGVTQIKLKLFEKGGHIVLLEGVNHIKPEEIAHYQVFCNGSEQYYKLLTKQINSFINDSTMLQSRKKYISLMDKFDYKLKPRIDSSFWRFFFSYTLGLLNNLPTIYQSQTQNLAKNIFLIFKADELKTCVYKCTCTNIDLIIYNTEIQGCLLRELLKNLGYFREIMSPFLGDYVFSIDYNLIDNEQSYKLITTDGSKRTIFNSINNIDSNFSDSNWSTLPGSSKEDALNFSLLLDNLTSMYQTRQTYDTTIKLGQEKGNANMQYLESVIYISVVGGLCVLAGLIVGLAGRNKP